MNNPDQPKGSGDSEGRIEGPAPPIEQLARVINERGYFVLWFADPQLSGSTHPRISDRVAIYDQPVLVLQETDYADFEEQGRIGGWHVDPNRPGAHYYRCTTD